MFMVFKRLPHQTSKQSSKNCVILEQTHTFSSSVLSPAPKIATPSSSNSYDVVDHFAGVFTQRKIRGQLVEVKINPSLFWKLFAPNTPENVSGLENMVREVFT